MNQVKLTPAHFNPFSDQLSEAGRKFSQINEIWKKVAVVTATIFAVLLTLPIGGIGGAAAFRFLVERFTARPTEELTLQTDKAGLTDSKAPVEHVDQSKITPLPNVEHNKKGLFVDVINARGYIQNGVEVHFPAPTIQKHTVELMVSNLKSLIGTNKNTEISLQDLSTEEAIAVDNGFSKIAINFANEHHAGGGPGMHLDPFSKQLVYDGNSAKAQEESLCQHTDLMAALTQLEHTLKKDNNSYMIRSYYNDPFDSRTMSYISQNHLFAVRGASFYELKFLDEPVPVSFITSAAPILSGKTVHKGDQHIQDLQLRITAHMASAAFEAIKLRKQHPSKPVELILGAFGCGAFAPLNGEEYAKFVANIYKQDLEQFSGIFDKVTFAVPTFGSNNPQDPCFRNYQAFKQVFES